MPVITQSRVVGIESDVGTRDDAAQKNEWVEMDPHHEVCQLHI